MISMKEILKGRVELEDLPEEHQKNLAVLLERINKLRALYGKPIRVNDGYRRSQDTPTNGSKTSMHLKGAAIDLDDNDEGTLWKFVFENRHKLAEWGLWVEHPCWTHCDGMSWVHFQVLPPNSGRRFFVPSSRPNPAPDFWDGVYEAELDSKDQPE
jgi:hypothetical protein